MKELNFYISDGALDRLFELKKQDKRDNITGNEYAAELLERLLYERLPVLPPTWED